VNSIGEEYRENNEDSILSIVFYSNLVSVIVIKFIFNMSSKGKMGEAALKLISVETFSEDSPSR
jgi:hypothetical protein